MHEVAIPKVTPMPKESTDCFDAVRNTKIIKLCKNYNDTINIQIGYPKKVTSIDLISNNTIVENIILEENSNFSLKLDLKIGESLKIAPIIEECVCDLSDEKQIIQC